jgi:hypothetical protein
LVSVTDILMTVPESPELRTPDAHYDQYAQ